MSYTAPTYVDTKEQAVLALASTIKGEAVTGGDGSVNRALDILADVLADQDVQVPQTDAGAILALAQYASGMVKPEGTIAITENGEGIDVAQYATADVSVSGGGSSDFTTAKLTFQKPAGAPLVCAYAGVDGVYPFIQAENGEVDVILYKGSAVAMYAAQGDITVSGDVTSDGGGMFTITGDGSIVIEQK